MPSSAETVDIEIRLREKETPQCHGNQVRSDERGEQSMKQGNVESISEFGVTVKESSELSAMPAGRR